MAKKSYIGINGVARKNKKGYIGINNVARKLKKAYIGIGGVARPCWGGGVPSYYGTISALSSSRNMLAAETVGNYALFAGGKPNNDATTIVDDYDNSLTRIDTAPNLPAARSEITTARVGNYALFAGGNNGKDIANSASSQYGDVYAYNISLTSTSAAGLSFPRYAMGGVDIGNYALFGGGVNGDYYGGSGSIAYISRVDTYNTSLTHTVLSGLFSRGYAWIGAGKVGNYALFGGGVRGASDDPTPGTFNKSTAAYNSSLTRVSGDDLTIAMRPKAASTKNYLVFRASTYALIYNGSLTGLTPLTGCYEKPDVGKSLGDFAVFSCNGQVEMFDDFLTRTVLEPLSVARTNLAATTIGKYLLFGGGYITSSRSNVVDVYVLA